MAQETKKTNFLSHMITHLEDRCDEFTLEFEKLLNKWKKRDNFVKASEEDKLSKVYEFYSFYINSLYKKLIFDVMLKPFDLDDEFNEATLDELFSRIKIYVNNLVNKLLVSAEDEIANDEIRLNALKRMQEILELNLQDNYEKFKKKIEFDQILDTLDLFTQEELKDILNKYFERDRLWKKLTGSFFTNNDLVLSKDNQKATINHQIIVGLINEFIHDYKQINTNSAQLLNKKNYAQMENMAIFAQKLLLPTYDYRDIASSYFHNPNKILGDINKIVPHFYGEIILRLKRFFENQSLEIWNLIYE
jgi:hypothetical protein